MLDVLQAFLSSNKGNKQAKTFSVFRRIKLAAVAPGSVERVLLFELPEFTRDRMLIQSSVSIKTAQDSFSQYPEVVADFGDSLPLPVTISPDGGGQTVFFTISKISRGTTPRVYLQYEGAPEFIDITLNFIDWG